MMQNGSGQARTSQPRIDTWRLGKNVLLALVLPCTIAIAADWLLGLWPLLTLLVAVFAFPIAGFVVMRAALQELQKVVQEIVSDEAAKRPVADEGGAEIDA